MIACVASAVCLGGAGAARASQWQVQHIPLPRAAFSSSLYGVSCPSRNDCVAVGYFANRSDESFPLALHWNGSRWRTQRVPTPRGVHGVVLLGVSCSAASACMAVGSGDVGLGKQPLPVVVRWDGMRWRSETNVEVAPAAFQAVSCTSGGACTAVGAAFNTKDCIRLLVARWNGRAWLPQEAPDPPCAWTNPLTGQSSPLQGGESSVSCPSNTTCVSTVALGLTNDAPFYGSLAVVEVWDGTTWRIQSSQLIRDFVHSTSCVSLAWCAAAAGKFLGQFDGTTWSEHRAVSETGGEGFNGVSCPSRTACTAAGGDDFGPLIASWNGTTWSRLQLPPPQPGATLFSLRGVSCPSRLVCAAVGEFFPKDKGWPEALVESTIRPSSPPIAVTGSAR